MTPARTTASLICAVAAIGAAAGAVVVRRAQTAANAAALQRNRDEVGGMLDTAQKALDGLQRGLEIEVKNAASIAQLKAALADGVDAATILDLFESEDWWAPFRSRGAALVTAGRTLAARRTLAGRTDNNDKRMPLPDAAMLDRAQTAGVASGLLIGDRTLVAAVVPVVGPRQGDATYLVLAMPLDAQDLQKATGVPVMISDGQRPVSVAGTAGEQATLSRLVGKEADGRASDPESTWLAQAAPVGPKLWLWVLHPVTAAPPSDAVPVLFGVVALLLGVAAVFLRRGGTQEQPAADAADAAAGSGIKVFGSPRLNVDELRKRRGTQPYENADEVGHRPTEMSGAAPAASVAPAWGAGVAGRAAELADSYPERARVETAASTFGRYRLLERLGEGGMAELYTAVLHGAEGFRRVYVVKRLRPEVARNRSAVEQFIDEAKLGSTLVHSNIVPVFDFGKVGNEYFLAQEYIIGRDVGKLLQRHMEVAGRPLSERLVLYIVHETLEALAYAHNRTDAAGKPIGLVHRDISPGNVMVTARGEVKLFDFGIVKGEGRVSKTDVGVVKGNVSFMSPEQARGQAVDGRSDLFSLGLVLYYGLTGEQLYPGQSTFDQLMRAATGPKTEQLKLFAELPPTSGALVARVLAVDPALRYQTAAEFAAAVAPHIAGGKAEAAELMQRLFSEDFKRENAT